MDILVFDEVLVVLKISEVILTPHSWWINTRNVKDDDVSYQDIIPTLGPELDVVEKT